MFTAFVLYLISYKTSEEMDFLSFFGEELEPNFHHQVRNEKIRSDTFCNVIATLTPLSTVSTLPILNNNAGRLFLVSNAVQDSSSRGSTTQNFQVLSFLLEFFYCVLDLRRF